MVRIGDAREFWARGMWRHERLDGSLAEVTGVVLARSVYIVVDAFRQDRIRLRAATLTFVTLLSLVPLIAVGFSLFTAFGGLEEAGERVKSLVIDAIAVQQREVVTQYLDQFVAGANAGGLGAMGSMLLFVTAVTTLSNIETAFNDIWGVSESRGWIRRFQVYLPLVTLGPVLFGVAFSTLLAVERSETVMALLEAAPGLRALFRLGPVLVYVILFSGLYLFLPNTRVRVGPAFAGGLIAGLLYVVGQQVFTIYAGRAISYSAIYGSFGAVPLTILWIYVSWTLVLLGATISFAMQSASSYEPERRIPQREREQLAAQLVLEVARRYQEGLGPTSAQALLDEARVPPHHGRRLLDELVEGKILIAVVLANEETGYAPTRPLGQTSLADVLSTLRGLPMDRTVPEAHVRGLDLLREAESETLARLRAEPLENLVRPGDDGPELGRGPPSPGAGPFTG